MGINVESGAVAGIGSGDSFPPNPDEGDTLYRTDLDSFFIYDGTDWVEWETDDHHGEHEPGGADEVQDINIGGTGTPLTGHHTRHEAGGADVVIGVAPAPHAVEHEVGGGDLVDHDNLTGFVPAEHLSLPNTIGSVLTNHTKAVHDALGIDADLVDGEHAADIVTDARVKAHFPDTIANILSDHDLTHHPLTIIPTMDDAHIPDVEGLSYTNPFAVAQIPTLSIAKISDIPGTIASILSDHTKAVHDALGLSHDSLSDVSTSDHHVKTVQRVDSSIPNIIEDTAANRPVAGTEGRIFFESDTGRVLYDDGAAWVEVGLSESEIVLGNLGSHTHDELTSVGSSDHHTKTGDNEVYGLVLVDLATNRPAAGTSGRWFIASDTLAISYDDGAAWNLVGTLGGLDLGTHASRHQNGGADEISVAGLSGDLADAQDPKTHENSHTSGGADEIDSSLAIAAIPTGVKTATITFIIDGGGSAITTGEKGHLEIPFACTIQRATMLADQSGSIVVDVWKDTYANFPPTDADSITASAPPTISTAQKSQDSTLTGWTTSISAGDILAFNVDSCATITRVTISLKVVK